MSYGDLPLDAPCKPNKGHEGGACNRRACQAEPALWFNHGSHSWYCEDCAVAIGQDHVNLRGWLYSPYYPGHPMFETREMMKTREGDELERRAMTVLGEPDPLSFEGIFGESIESALGFNPKPKRVHSTSLERLLAKGRRNPLKKVKRGF